MTGIDEMLAADGYARMLGIRRVAGVEGVAVEMVVGPQHLNFHGVTHGGVVFSLADAAFSLASNAAGERAVAIDTHLVLTAATGEGDRLVAVAEEATRGRTLGTYRVSVTRDDGRVVGLFTGTVHITPGAPASG
ncbi:MAG: hotdog fold thioesterase [Acidimicrobiia bacterium]|nr:MAG: hotdog fold thioesterase [Acidimicrobiia bacterium]